MNNKKYFIFVYKKIAQLYNFIFARKNMQFINNIIFSLSLGAKGYKNYGSFSSTGEKNFIKLISREINLSLDIGANVGKYTKLILDETESNVISFEPMPKAFQKIEEIRKIYSNRLLIYKVALGNENSKKNINYSNEISEKASLDKDLEKISFIGNKNINQLEVEVKKLDSFEESFKNKKIDFIKIDTEGYEYEVLKGAEIILNKHKPKFIQIEFNWHQLFKNQTLYNICKLVPFSNIFQILPHGCKLIKIDPSRPESNIYHLSNFVFIRKDISKNFE